MTNVTRILDSAAAGDPSAAAELLPLVYDELRKLASCRLAEEKPGQTFQPTALVHEAYVRLFGGQNVTSWNSRGHFFAAAAEAMRRILVDSARRKRSEKRGGGQRRVCLDDATLAIPERSDDLIDLDDALVALENVDKIAADLVKLRYFAGMTMREAADTLGLAPRTADAVWAYARAWLLDRLQGPHSSKPPQ